MITAQDQKGMDTVKVALLSGVYFDNIARSEGSVRGYQPPANRQYYSHIIATLGQMACESDLLAQVASRLVGKLNLYSTNHELKARLFSEAATIVRGQYDDVIGRTGPEPIRYSDAHREFTLRERIIIAAWLEKAAPSTSSVPGLGWAITYLAQEMGIYLR